MGERVSKGKALDANIFMKQKLLATKELVHIQDKGKTEAPSIKLDMFNPDQWTSWSKQFVTYLLHITGQQFALLNYLLHQKPAPIFLTDMDK